MRSAFAPLVLAFAVGVSAPAFAHAHLQTAIPAPNSTTRTAPTEVSIAFTEGVEARFSRIEVQNPSGQRVDSGDPHTAPDNNKRLIVGLRAITPGTYTVAWHATSVDTHKTDGTFHFTVQP